jgi:hypothetical protein
VRTEAARLDAAIELLREANSNVYQLATTDLLLALVVVELRELQAITHNVGEVVAEVRDSVDDLRACNGRGSR